MSKEKKDYSATCNLNDEDKNNDCWGCSRFCFPIGCMVFEDGKGRAKLKVTEARIITGGTKTKPYYKIKYLEVGNEKYSIGFGSYILENVQQWLEENFEIVK